MMDGITSAQEQNARNMRDFLQLYSRLTEQCFQRCVLDFNHKDLSSAETDCVDVCASRYVSYNQRLMFTFMEFQNAKQDAAIKEMEQAAAEGRQPNLPGLSGLPPPALQQAMADKDTKGDNQQGKT